MNVIEAVQDALTTPRMYPDNSVPPKPEYHYGSFTAMLGRAHGRGLDGNHGLRDGRVIIRTFSKSPDGAGVHMESVIADLLGKRLDVDGFECTPLEMELNPAITRDPDDAGVITMTATLTFVASSVTFVAP